MASLQRVIAQIASRLRDINASQGAALLLGGALVALSLIWLAQWAASPEMVPLLPEQDLQADELALVRGGLEAMNEPFEVRGNRVYVRASANRQALLAQLQQREQLPANTSVGFTALVKESDPWISQAENTRRWTFALQKELETVLRWFQGVKSASVFLNLNAGRQGFSKLPPANSASVTLVMKHGEGVPRSLALAAARLVSGAVAGLTPENVQVLDANHGPALDWESERDPTNHLNAQRVKLERHYAEKIRLIIPDPQALVSVQVELDTTTRSSQTETPIKGVPRTDETTSDESTRTHPSGQAGVQPNVGIAAGSGRADENRKQDTTKTEFDTGVTVKTEATPAGDLKLVSAAISLSSSYLEGVFRRANPDVEAPTDAQLEEVFQRERGRLVAQVAKLVKPQTEENVDIQRYYDTALEPIQAGPAGTLDEALDLMRKYGPQSGLGLLALISLGLMLRLARKSDAGESFGLELGLPKEAIEAAKLAASDVASAAARARQTRGGRRRAGRPGEPGAEFGEAMAEGALGASVGQASATEGVLVAQEVDAGTVQTRKMLDQVTQMAESDPQAVSSLVEQWVQRNERYYEGA